MLARSPGPINVVCVTFNRVEAVVRVTRRHDVLKRM